MAWSPFFSDACTDTAFVSLPSHNAAWAQNGAMGNWRISANGTSAGCVVFATARCYLVSAPGPLQAFEYTVAGSLLERETGIMTRFTEDDTASFWGGIGYVSYIEAGHQLLTHRLDGGGSHTQIASGSYTPVSGDTRRDEWPTLTKLSVLVNGVEQYNVTDATYASGTVGPWAGVSIDDASSMSIDNLAAYEQADARRFLLVRN